MCSATLRYQDVHPDCMPELGAGLSARLHADCGNLPGRDPIGSAPCVDCTEEDLRPHAVAVKGWLQTQLARQQRHREAQGGERTAAE